MSDGWVRTERGWTKRYGPPREHVSHGSDFPTPRIASDVMPLTEHIDGKFYDSKSQFRRVTRENGCIEVGNDPERLRLPERSGPDREANRQAVQKALDQAGI